MHALIRSAVAVILLVLTLPAYAGGVDQVGADPAVIARGKALYAGTCGAYCHRSTPSNTDALFLFDCTWKHGATDDDIFRLISEGSPGTRMVGFGGAFPEGDADIRAIIAYLRDASQCRP